MQVQTYEISEITRNMDEGEREAATELVREMELEGQDLYIGDTDEEACPYRKMTAPEYQVFHELMDEQTELKSYSDGPIPLRILQLAKHAEEFFEKLWVWHPKSADIKDPLLVGVNTTGEYSTREYYLLARWGDELAEFTDLALIAGQRLKDKLGANIRSVVATATAEMSALESMDVGQVMAMKKDSVTYYGLR